MIPPSGAGQPMTAASAPGSGNVAVMQLRKALGLPENQPAPEQKVIEACTGSLGPELKRLAISVGQQGGMRPAPTEAPTMPEQGQPGGENRPPNPQGGDTADAPSVQPGAGTEGKMGSSTIFGRRPVSATGEQAPGGAAEPDEDDEMAPNAGRIFGGRR